MAGERESKVIRSIKEVLDYFEDLVRRKVLAEQRGNKAAAISLGMEIRAVQDALGMDARQLSEITDRVRAKPSNLGVGS